MTTAETAATALPVRPGEEPWTVTELAEVQAELEAEATELRAETDQAGAAIAVSGPPSWPQRAPSKNTIPVRTRDVFLVALDLIAAGKDSAGIGIS